jgi:hypothetical protein
MSALPFPREYPMVQELPTPGREVTVKPSPREQPPGRRKAKVNHPRRHQPGRVEVLPPAPHTPVIEDGGIVGGAASRPSGEEAATFPDELRDAGSPHMATRAMMKPKWLA